MVIGLWKKPKPPCVLDEAIREIITVNAHPIRNLKRGHSKSKKGTFKFLGIRKDGRESLRSVTTLLWTVSGARLTNRMEIE
jgi:hypothetical protein